MATIAAMTGDPPLPRKNRQRWRRRAGWLLPVLAPIVALLLLDRQYPPPLPTGDSARAGSVVLAADGRPLRAFAGVDGVWRTPTTPDQVSPLYLQALLAYEDRRFHHHPGIDPLALGRAAWQALRHGGIVSGGSTLTMQVARILEPPGRRHSLAAKARQMLRALQLEWHLDKEGILRLYLDHAPFGGTVEGVAAASWAWLGKPPDRLSHAEAALLAVLPQAPSRNRPDRHPQRAQAARDKVLRRLRDLGVWDAGAVAAALQEPVVSRQLKPPLQAPLLAERLRRQSPRAARITSLIDADLQAQAEARVAAWLVRLPPATSAAVLIVDSRTMAVRAYVGAGRYGDAASSGHVDMVTAPRSPGSALKPMLYGMALDEGLIHSESLLLDAPQSIAGYRPANFDSGFRGPVSAAEALRLSLNVPAVDLLERLGPGRFSARLGHAGVPLRLPRGARPNLAMILGGTATTLEELVVAFSALARDGLAARLRYRPDDRMHERRLMSAEAAFIVRQMLGDPPAPGSLAGALARPVPLVAKTGTSWGYRDAWAIGVQPGWVLGVWIGRPDGTPSPGQYGAITALPLLQSLAASLPRSRTGFGAPAGVARAPICWPLGTAPDPQQPQLCHQQRQAWTMQGVLPPTLPQRAAGSAAPVMTWLRDGQGKRRLPGCAEGQILEPVQVARWPVLAGPWLDAESRRRSQPPEWASACRHLAAEPAQGLHLSGLQDGTRLKTVPGHDPGQAWLVATAHGGQGDIWWLVDDRLAGRTRDGGRQRLEFPGPGTHRVVVVDGSGNHASATVQVLP